MTFTFDIAAVIGALAVLITAITGLILALRGVKKEVAEVHTIMNSKSDAQLDRIDQLTRVIVEASPGMTLPPNMTGRPRGQRYTADEPIDTDDESERPDPRR